MFNFIANDCTGGELYKVYDIEYKSPFVWSVVTLKDFITLMEKYDDIDFAKVEYQETPNYIWPHYMSSVRVDSQFSIYYPHYIHDENAEGIVPYDAYGVHSIKSKDMEKYIMETYEKRMKRMDGDPIFIFSQENRNEKEDLIKLLTCKSRHKLIFITSDKELQKYASERVKIIFKPKNEVLQSVQAKAIKEYCNNFINEN